MALLRAGVDLVAGAMASSANAIGRFRAETSLDIYGYEKAVSGNADRDLVKGSNATMILGRVGGQDISGNTIGLLSACRSRNIPLGNYTAARMGVGGIPLYAYTRFDGRDSFPYTFPMTYPRVTDMIAQDDAAPPVAVGLVMPLGGANGTYDLFGDRITLHIANEIVLLMRESAVANVMVQGPCSVSYVNLPPGWVHPGPIPQNRRSAAQILAPNQTAVFSFSNRMGILIVRAAAGNNQIVMLPSPASLRSEGGLLCQRPVLTDLAIPPVQEHPLVAALALNPMMGTALDAQFQHQSELALVGMTNPALYGDRVTGLPDPPPQ